MPNINHSEYFKTTNLGFAAFLKTADIPWVACEFAEGGTGRKVFLFENSPIIRDLKDLYFRRQPANISPLRYHEELQSLKTLVHM